MIEIKGNLVLGIPKTGSQSLAVYIMGRQMPFTHKKYSEYNRPFFNVYALWRDPVDRFKSALKFDRKFTETPRSVDEVILGLSEDKSLFFKPQSYWLDEVPEDKLVLLPYAQYEESLEFIAARLGKRIDFIPRIHKTEGEIDLTTEQLSQLKDFYEEDYKYLECLKMPNL